VSQTEEHARLNDHVAGRKEWFAGAIPTLVVLAALGGLALWGHHAGWKLPSFAQLTGNSQKPTDDWCDEHGVPESNCAVCTESVFGKVKAFGWCKVHGLHECPFEHPEVAQLTVSPKITGADLARAKKALDFVPRLDNSSRCRLHPALVQVASQAIIDKLGLKFEPVWTGPIEETVIANGEIGYDPTRIASLASIVPGKVWSADKKIGEAVQKGEVLALIDAAEVGKAKAGFLKSVLEWDLRVSTLERMKLLAGTVVAKGDILKAEAAVKLAEADLISAQQALINLGFPVHAEEFKGLSLAQMSHKVQFLGVPPEIVDKLDPKTTTGNLIPVRAPLSGVVLDRRAVPGEMVDPAKTLFVVGDTNVMWLKLFVKLEDVKYLQLGQIVRFQHAGAMQPVEGKISWVSTAVDKKTRTVQVRAELNNSGATLKANTFGTGTIVLRQEPEAIVVPNAAVHWDGNCYIVFVKDKNFSKKDAPKVFHVRSVRLGVKTATQTEIIAGVLPGEIVATENSGALRTQLLKNNLGEG
jgi:cobalt-zinc-cadmium efflux system membrane fusion protein